MTAAALATPLVLRNAAGEPPLGVAASFFRDDQGEMSWHPVEAYRSPASRIGVLELEDGQWLAQPPGFFVDGPRFASRDAALTAAVEAVVAKAQKFMANGEGDGTHWTAAYGNAQIAWAETLKPSPVIACDKREAFAQGSGSEEAIHPAPQDVDGRVKPGHDEGEEITPPANPNNVLGVKTRLEEITDPVIAELVSAKRARTAWPAGHCISMTNPIINGHMVTMGTCECGHVFSYQWGSYERADAASEAHWQKHDAAPDKVDGRGQPVDADGSAIEPVKKVRAKRSVRRNEPGDEAIPQQDGNDAATRMKALRSIAAGEDVDWSITRDLVGEGLLHATATRLIVTDEGYAFLHNRKEEITGNGDASQYLQSEHGRPGRLDEGVSGAGAGDDGAPEQGDPGPSREQTPAAGLSSAASQEKQAAGVAPGRSEAVEAAQICAGSPEVSEPPVSEGLTAHGTEIDPAREAGLRGGSLALDDSDDLAIDWPSYETFLEDKIVTAPLRGIEVARDDLHPWLKPHCRDLTVWALRLGCAAIFANFGLHKTAMQLEWCRQLHKRCGGATLNVVPLGVRHGFIKEAVQLDMDVRFIRTDAEYHALYAEGVRHFLTNYESIREGKLDPNLFGACSLDEASVLRSYGSKTFQEFLPLFAKVTFKLVATATPSPNRYKELIHYAGFLGVMDTGLALTRWFQRNSEKAGDLTLYPHKADEFWMFIHSFCAFLQKPSELGHSDQGYDLPPLKLTWCEVLADHSKAAPERDGQGVMFRNVANSLSEAASARRDSLAPRVTKMLEIIGGDPDATWLIWHDLEAEREAIEAALPDVVTIMGSMDIDAREARLHDFEEGRIRKFATKPILSGSGSNFQYHCHKAIYLSMPGYGYKFNDFIQSLYRLQRFGQLEEVEVWIVYAEDERAGRAALEQKWALDAAMRAKMSEIILAHGLNTLPLRDAMLRSMGVKRVEVRGQNFVAVNNDAVAECRTWPDNSVDLMVSSIPFGKQYEYSPSYRDFGHSDDNAHFWSQMDFLSSELLRMLKPGRLFCCHVKDRILFGAVTGQGVPTVEPFHAEAIMHYRAHGFQYMGMITVVTDVVRENNQTYRLGWSENAKDGTKMGCGMPEYILLLRKPQSDRSRSYADVPVEKSKEDYTRARWQIDAHALWRSSGNRHLTPEEFAQCSSADLAKLFAKTTVDRVYDYEAHVAIGEAVERTGTLPATFMAIAPGSHHPDVWHDINRMRTLNMLQQRKGAEMHLCPLQFDIVDRLIERYSNEGELVFDPFGGLMTVPYRALLKKRRGAAVELSSPYYLDGLHYCHMAEEKMETPELFDLASFDAANAPPPLGTDGG